MMSSRKLTLPEAAETAQVREAKDAVRQAGLSAEPKLVNWALRMIEDRDCWRNHNRRR